MKLPPLDRPDRIELAGRWLSAERNAKWLDFGNGVQGLTPGMLRVMTQRDIHCLRLRQCHYIDGQPYDRRLYDILAREHQEI